MPRIPTRSVSFVVFATILSACRIIAQVPVTSAGVQLKTSMPVFFEENRGQFQPATRFVTRNGEGVVRFTEEGPEFVLGKAQGQSRIELRPEVKSSGTELHGEDPMVAKVNYFLGSHASAEFQGISTFGRLRYSQFMPGVNLTFYGTGRTLEHDFVVSPAVNPESVRFRLTGADSVRLTGSGELEIKTHGSEMLFRKPVSYQMIAGKRTLIPTRFALDHHGVISFEAGKYDRTQDLVIDPVLVFSTYLDGTHADVPATVTTDSAGNIYVAGNTTSADFPVANSYQATCGICTDGGFGESGYLAKLDPTGKTLLYSTFFVGNGQTDIDRIKVDSVGNIVGVGYTASTNFPRVGKYPTTYTNGLMVFSLNSTGTVLNHSEIVGAAETAYGAYGSKRYDLAVDSASNVYIAGRVFVYSYLALKFPVTTGTYGSGKTILTSSDEIFVTKLASDGSLTYSTIVPPASSSFSGLYMGGLAIDSAGDAYVSGTAATGLPTTAGTVSPSFPNGNPGNVAYSGDAGFVLALNPTASQLLFSTYLPGTDNANTLTMANDGSLYVAGTTSESTLPVSANAFQSTLKKGAGCTCDGAYILRLNATGTQVVNATYLSGTNEYNNSSTAYAGAALDSSGAIYVGGITAATDFTMVNPVVSYLDQTGNITVGGTVLAGLSPDLSTLVFSSYFNGDGAGDHLADMTISSANRLVLTGGTYSNANFLTTENSFQPNAPAQLNAGVGYQHEFVASIDLLTAAPSVCLSTRSIAFGSVSAGSSGTVSLTLTNCGNAPLTVSSLTSSSSLVSASPLIASLAVGQSYPILAKYSPVDSSAVSGSVTITSNATVPTERFFFTGQGVAPKISTPTSVVLSQMVVGTTPATGVSVLVQNTGNAPLTISSVTISGEFTQANSCVRSLAANALCVVSVTFAPVTAGTKQGTVTIASNDPTTPQVSVSVTGTALSTFPAPALTALSQQTQVTGATNAALTLTGSNFFPQSIVRVNGKAATTTFASGTSLRVTLDPTTISTIGEIPITVVNPAPGGGESNALTLTLYQSIANAGAVMTYVPATGLFYVASNSNSTVRPNTVVAVNPSTGAVGTPLSVGKDPALLASSADGTYLFLANRTDYTLQRIPLASGVVDRTFPYPSNVFCTTCYPVNVTSILPVPGSPASLVVAQDSYLSLYGDSGLVSELSTPTYGSLATDYLTYSGNPAHVYSYPFSSTDNFFKQFTVDGTGVHALTTSGTASKATGETDFSVTAAGTQIYTSSGNVWESTSKQLLTTIPLSIYNFTSNPNAVSIAVDPTLARVYYGGDQSSGVTITAYDTKAFAAQASVTFSDSSMLYTTNLSRWGTDGFGFLSGTSLILFRSSALSGTSLLTPTLTFAVADHVYGDAPITVTANSNSSGTINYVVLSGPATVSGSTVTITGSGVVVLQAIQSASGAYALAEATATFNVSAPATNLTLTVPNHTYGDPAFALSATSSSPGAITYSVLAGPASLAGTTLTITGAGKIMVQASQAASGNYAPATQTATFQVSPAALTVKSNDAARVYGAANPTFTGSVSGAVNGDTFSESFTTAATVNSPVGAYSIVPSAIGSVLANYTVMVINSTLTITQAAAGVSLSASGNSISSGQSSTFSLAVSSSTGGLCTGAVTLADNGGALSTIPLINGAAAYTTTLASGFTHQLSAAYAGDANCVAAATTSNVLVAVSGIDTSVTTSPASQQASAGATITYTLQLTPGVGSFPAAVVFTAQGLPSGFTATFSPSTITVGSTAQTVQLSLKAPATKAMLQSPELPNKGSHTVWPIAFGFFLFPLLGRRKFRRNLVGLPAFIGAVCLGTLLSLAGCSSSPHNTTQTIAQMQSYLITVTATSGSVQHQATVTLVW